MIEFLSIRIIAIRRFGDDPLHVVHHHCGVEIFVKFDKNFRPFKGVFSRESLINPEHNAVVDFFLDARYSYIYIYTPVYCLDTHEDSSHSHRIFISHTVQ